jgi:hypothetical protein
MFLCSIKSACSSAPTCHFTGIARKFGQIRRLRRDRSRAQPPLGAGPEPRAAPAWGEHGEDPQFDRAKHEAMLVAKAMRLRHH